MNCNINASFYYFSKQEACTRFLLDFNISHDFRRRKKIVRGKQTRLLFSSFPSRELFNAILFYGVKLFKLTFHTIVRTVTRGTKDNKCNRQSGFFGVILFTFFLD